MNTRADYPWQAALWAQCRQRISTDTLPHALLLTGQRGLGKLEFAHRLAQLLLCDRPGDAACGACRGCHLFLAGTHPDYLETTTEADSAQIKIEQIRALNYFVGLSRQYGHHKVVLIAHPEAMNRSAANSLLKTLEEPPAFSLILLVTSRPTALPATIVSRCQRIVFKVPPPEAAAEWLRRQVPGADAATLLAIASGAPLAALELTRGELQQARQAAFKDILGLVEASEAPVAVASRWRQHMPDPLLGWLISWLADIARLQSNGAFNRLNNPDIDQGLRRLAKRIDSKSLFALYDNALQHRRMQHGSLNPRLLLEDLLLAWTSAFTQLH